MKDLIFSQGFLYLRFSILGLLLVSLLGIPYDLNLMQEPLFLIIAALILGLGFSSMWQSSYRESKKAHYLHFLSYLSGRLNMGVSLERALYESVEPLAKELGQHQVIIRALKSLRSNLNAQMALDDVLQVFAEKMQVDVCTEDMRLLSLMASAGGKVEEFIKQRHRSLSTQISIQTDVVTEYKGKSTEAILLSVMPFLMAFFFLQKNVQDSCASTPVVWRGLLFLGAVFAIFLVMRIVYWREPAPQRKVKSKKSKIDKKNKKGKINVEKPNRWTKFMSRLYLDLLPGNLGLRLSAALVTVSDDGEASWTQYFNEKKVYLVSGINLFLISRLIGTVSISAGVVLAVFPGLFQDIALLAKARDMRIHYRYYAPYTISTIEILLSSRLTLERSLQILGQTSSSISDTHALERDIRQAVHLLDKGYSGYDAVHFLAERCPLPEIQSALQLMARYSQQGGSELLELLHLQTQHIWQLFRHTQQNLMEHRMMRLVIPMALDLFIIIATISLPFIFEFKNIL